MTAMSDKSLLEFKKNSRKNISKIQDFQIL